MKAYILAGGLGTRLKPLTDTVPKPLIEINGKPLIRYVIDILPDEVDEIIISTNYLSDQIKTYFENNPLKQNTIILKEIIPMGSSGTLKQYEKIFTEPFFVLNSDIISNIDTKKLLEFFNEKENAIGVLTLFEMQHTDSFGVAKIDDNKRIIQFREKKEEDRNDNISKLVNAGVSIYSPEILKYITPGPGSMERDVYPNILDKGLYGYVHNGYWIDCGTMDNLKLANELVKNYE